MNHSWRRASTILFWGTIFLGGCSGDSNSPLAVPGGIGGNGRPTTIYSLAILSGNNQSTIVDGTLPSPMILQVRNHLGAPAAGITVTGTVRNQAGLLNGTVSASRATDAQGQAQFTWTMPSVAGTVYADFVIHVNGTDTIATASALAEAATETYTLAITSGNGQSIGIGETLLSHIIVRVTTTSGQPASDIEVVGTVRGQGGVLYGQSSATVPTDSDGYARFQWTMPSVAQIVYADFMIVGDSSQTATASAHATSDAVTDMVFTEIQGFIPGQVATLVGSGLGGLLTVQVGGYTASVTVISATQIQFPVPVMRECEIDGRPVTISSGGANLQWPVQAPDRIDLDIGGTVVLSGDMLSCASLPAEGDFLLTLMNASSDPIRVPVGTLTTLTTNLASPVSSWAISERDPGRMGAVNKEKADDQMMLGASSDIGTHLAAAAGLEYSDSPTPFDANLATDGVGERVNLVDWHAGASCTSPKESTLSFQAEIIGLSGQHVILADTRLPNFAQYESAEGKARYAKVASIVDELFLPASYLTYQAGFEPLKGAGGRHFTLITDYPGSSGGLSLPTEQLPQSYCNNSSEILIGQISPEAIDRKLILNASTAIHELGHAVSVVLMIRRETLGAWTPSWAEEAFAANLQEGAGRIQAGQMEGLLNDDSGDESIYLPWGFGPHYPSAILSPWDAGKYVLGAHLLLYAREQLGLHLSNSPSPFILRWGEAGFTPEALADFVGMPLIEFLDQGMTSLLYDGLLDDETRERNGLGVVRSWDGMVTWDSMQSAAFHMEWPDRMFSRTTAKAFDVQIAGGSYEWWKIPGDDELGVSFSFEANAGAPDFRLRLVRVR